MGKNKAKQQVTAQEGTSEVEQMGEQAAVTIGVYFDHAVNKYVQVKLMFDPDTSKCVILSKKTLTSNRNLAILSSATIDLVKILQNELE